MPDPLPAPPRPRPHSLLVAAIASLAILFLAVTLQKIWAADTWWQLRTGQWIVQNGTLPSVDIFSATAAGNPWIEMRWLYCVVLYGVWSLGGPGLGVIVQSLMIGLAFGLICWPSRRALATPMGLGILALGIVGGMSRWVLRPELVSYVMIPMYLLLLDGATRGRYRRLIWVLPVLQVLWTNAHTLFIFGPVLAWTFVAGDTFGRVLRRVMGHRRFRFAEGTGAEHLIDLRLIGVALLTTLACWLNPYGYAGAMFPFILLEEIRPGHILGDAIAEFRSPLDAPLGHWSWDMHAALILAIVTLGTFGLRPRWIDWSRVFLFIGGLYVASLAQRNVGILAIFATWIALRNLSTGLAVTAYADAGGRLRRPAFAAIALVCLVAAWYIASDRLAIRSGAARETGIGLVHRNFPTTAIDLALAVGCQPPIYNAMSDGGYLIWRAHGVLPVYSDGRLEVYTNEFFKEYFIDGPANWPEMARRRGINTVIVPVMHYEWLVSSLAESRSWALVFMDHRTVVLVRAIPEHADLIAARRIDPRSWTPTGPEPDERPDAWKRLIGAPPNPWYSIGMAHTLLTLGAGDQAEVYLKRAIERGGDTRPRLMLAGVHAANGRFHDAREMYQEALGTGGGSWQDWANLGLINEQLGDPGSAAAAYRRALKIEPDAHQVHRQLGALLARTGHKDEAAACFERALQLNPDDAQAREALRLLRQD